jgi:hypothetical protein
VTHAVPPGDGDELVLAGDGDGEELVAAGVGELVCVGDGEELAVAGAGAATTGTAGGCAAYRWRGSSGSDEGSIGRAMCGEGDRHGQARDQGGS